jgi:hypothetical protein
VKKNRQGTKNRKQFVPKIHHYCVEHSHFLLRIPHLARGKCVSPVTEKNWENCIKIHKFCLTTKIGIFALCLKFETCTIIKNLNLCIGNWADPKIFAVVPSFCPRLIVYTHNSAAMQQPQAGTPGQRPGNPGQQPGTPGQQLGYPGMPPGYPGSPKNPMSEAV